MEEISANSTNFSQPGPSIEPLSSSEPEEDRLSPLVIIRERTIPDRDPITQGDHLPSELKASLGSVYFIAKPPVQESLPTAGDETPLFPGVEMVIAQGLYGSDGEMNMATFDIYCPDTTKRQFLKLYIEYTSEGVFYKLIHTGNQDYTRVLDEKSILALQEHINVAIGGRYGQISLADRVSQYWGDDRNSDDLRQLANHLVATFGRRATTVVNFKNDCRTPQTYYETMRDVCVDPITDPKELAMHRLQREIEQSADNAAFRVMVELRLIELYIEAVAEEKLVENTFGIMPAINELYAQARRYKSGGSVSAVKVEELLESCGEYLIPGLSITEDIRRMAVAVLERGENGLLEEGSETLAELENEWGAIQRREIPNTSFELDESGQNSHPQNSMTYVERTPEKGGPSQDLIDRTISWAKTALRHGLNYNSPATPEEFEVRSKLEKLLGRAYDAVQAVSASPSRPDGKTIFDFFGKSGVPLGWLSQSREESIRDFIFSHRRSLNWIAQTGKDPLVNYRLPETQESCGQRIYEFLKPRYYRHPDQGIQRFDEKLIIAILALPNYSARNTLEKLLADYIFKLPKNKEREKFYARCSKVIDRWIRAKYPDSAVAGDPGLLAERDYCLRIVPGIRLFINLSEQNRKVKSTADTNELKSDKQPVSLVKSSKNQMNKLNK